MSMTTFSAQVDDESGLAKQFREYRQQMGMNKSEAVRSLMREGLERELDGDGHDDRRPAHEPAQGNQPADWIAGNEPILMGLAFLVGSDGILASLQTVAGDATGQLLFAALGGIIVITLIPSFIDVLSQLANRGEDEQTDQAAMGAD